MSIIYDAISSAVSYLSDKSAGTFVPSIYTFTYGKPGLLPCCFNYNVNGDTVVIYGNIELNLESSPKSTTFYFSIHPDLYTKNRKITLIANGISTAGDGIIGVSRCIDDNKRIGIDLVRGDLKNIAPGTYDISFICYYRK